MFLVIATMLKYLKSETYLQAVRNGELKIVPSSYEKVWYNWLENCRLVMLTSCFVSCQFFGLFSAIFPSFD